MIKNIIKKQMKKAGFVRALEMENEKLKIQIKKLEVEKKNLEIEKLKVTEDNIKIIKENEKFRTVPDFKDLKLALKGKEGYLFLVNDSNNEIRQHFDQSYINNFNPSYFTEILKHKGEYCKNKNIEYFFFIMPDKSYICRNLLPFNIKLIKRNYDLIKHLVPDFSEKLDHTCYFNTDSHIHYLGGKEISYHILNYINNNFEREDFNKLIDEQILIESQEWPSDLVSPDNWSYSEEERVKYGNEETVTLFNKYREDLKDNLPEKFRFVGIRETEYYLNENAFVDLKALILRDSSTNLLKDVLSSYFKETLLYWDHWKFNKELIDWYKPDIILEIRTERFLEGMESIHQKIDEDTNKVD